MTKISKFTFNICLIFFLGLFFQCKDTTQSETDIVNNSLQSVQSQIITEKDVSSIKYVEFALSDHATKACEDWNKFQTLSIHIEDLKKGNLSFFKDDKALLKGFITDLKTDVPSSLSKSSILVRLNVLETTLYKLDETANLKNVSKERLLEDIENILTTFNNIVYQINKETEKEAQKIERPY